MKRTLTPLLAALFLLGASAGSPAQRKGMVGILAMSSSADGCGCYFSFNKADDRARRLIFFASHEDSGNDAWMNIDGSDTRLSLVRETKPKGGIKVGSRFTSRYASGDVTVDMVRVVTWVCPPRDEGCEIAKYSTTFTVRKGGRTQIVRAVGSCGC